MIVYSQNLLSEKELYQEEKSNIGIDGKIFIETFDHFSIEHEFDPDYLTSAETISGDTDKSMIPV